MGHGILMTGAGNPWDYLNGTNIDFGLDAGNANQLMSAIYWLLRNGGLTIATIVLAVCFLKIATARDSKVRSGAKEDAKEKMLLFIIIVLASVIMTLIMKICNIAFGIST